MFVIMGKQLEVLKTSLIPELLSHRILLSAPVSEPLAGLRKPAALLKASQSELKKRSLVMVLALPSVLEARAMKTGI